MPALSCPQDITTRLTNQAEEVSVTWQMPTAVGYVTMHTSHSAGRHKIRFPLAKTSQTCEFYIHIKGASKKTPITPLLVHILQRISQNSFVEIQLLVLQKNWYWAFKFVRKYSGYTVMTSAVTNVGYFCFSAALWLCFGYPDIKTNSSSLSARWVFIMVKCLPLLKLPEKIDIPNCLCHN